MRMKALKSFFGNEGRVKAGREFHVANKHRADDLELRGLAVSLTDEGQLLVPVENKAALAGPLEGGHGGETGGAKPPLSSPAAPAPQTFRARSDEIERDSSSSTKDIASLPSQKSSTPATEHGGKRKRGRPRSAG